MNRFNLNPHKIPPTLDYSEDANLGLEFLDGSVRFADGVFEKGYALYNQAISEEVGRAFEWMYGSFPEKHFEFVKDPDLNQLMISEGRAEPNPASPYISDGGRFYPHCDLSLIHI